MGSSDHEASRNTIAPGATFSHVFRKAGTFRYHCSIHPSMKGKIVVT
jgi:plastocyanin